MAPHLPQFRGSLFTLTQVLPHRAKPLLQVNPQTPAEQVAVEFAGGGGQHWMPHRVNPGLQTNSQMLFIQAVVELAGPGAQL